MILYFGREGVMPVIAIDGPSGSGKSSTSRALAQRFGWGYLDTGALYRAITVLALRHQASDIHALIQRLEVSPLRWSGDPTEPRIWLAEEEVTHEIRSEAVTNLVSEIAANDVVRSTLLSIQRSIINNAVLGIVVEGRDIGTTVWPDAELKIFLTADVSARAQRRRAELVGEFTAKEVQQSLANRDRIDSTRAVSPLRQSEDQIQIDATTMSLEEVVNALSELIRERKLDQSGS